MKSKQFLKKINLLNKTTVNLMAEENNYSIIKNFTDEIIKIFEADFGFAWGKFNGSDGYKLTYKSSTTPYNPSIPRRKRVKVLAIKGRNAIYDSNVISSNYETNIDRYLKSYIIIPVRYVHHVYGSIVLCYKKRHDFTEEDFLLSDTIGNIIAQTVTVNWLVANEQKALVLAEKQKESEILLGQEKLKTEFIANTTHELRTPLAIIKGNVDLALLRDKGKKRRYSDMVMHNIDTEVKHLSNMLTDLSMLTSRSADLKKRMVYGEVDICGLISKLVRRLKIVANKKNISIQCNKNIDVNALGDKVYLEKAFANLIKNSITYGKRNGTTKIEIKKDNGNVLISVKDDGIGIEKEDLEHVFERFYRADKSHNSDGNRTGLGLAIVKWVVEAHNGTIRVDSVIKKGTVFTVSLPTKLKNP